MSFYSVFTILILIPEVTSSGPFVGLRHRLDITRWTTALKKEQKIQINGHEQDVVKRISESCIQKIRGGSTADDHDTDSRKASNLSKNNSGSGETKVKKKNKKKKKKIAVDIEETIEQKTKRKKIIKKNLLSSKEKAQKKSNQSKSSSATTTKNAKSGECLRRIKNEWKTMIELGIGYDWIAQQTITKANKKKNNNETSRDGRFYKYNYIRIGPLQNNLLHWHFSVQGPSNSVYQNGIYHGRIILPKTYPGHPPRIQILTPSGRFVTGDDICLSVSAFHPETWSPRWTILSLVDALRIHMLTTANEIGGLHSSDEMREKFALSSRKWKLGCFDHGRMVQDGLFSPPPSVEEDETFDDKNDELEVNVDKECDALKFHDRKDEEDLDRSSDVKEMGISETVAFIASTKETKKSTKTTMNSDDQEGHSKQSNHGINPTSSSSNRNGRLERRPPKQSVILLTFRGIIEFFQRHIELGIIFVCIFFLFR